MKILTLAPATARSTAVVLVAMALAIPPAIPPINAVEISPSLNDRDEDGESLPPGTPIDR